MAPIAHFALEPMPAEWDDPEYRSAAMEAHVFEGVAWQVRVNREERGLTQAELAAAIGTRQSAISRLEAPDGGDLRISTLAKVAMAFDCALVVRLVPYSTLASITKDLRSERLYACAYEHDRDARASNPFEIGYE